MWNHDNKEYFLSDLKMPSAPHQPFCPQGTDNWWYAIPCYCHTVHDAEHNDTDPSHHCSEQCNYPQTYMLLYTSMYLREWWQYKQSLYEISFFRSQSIVCESKDFKVGSIITMPQIAYAQYPFKSSLPGQNGRHFTGDIFRCIIVNEKFCIFITISLKFVPKGPIDNNPALVQIMAWLI